MFPGSAGGVAEHLELRPEPRSAGVARKFVVSWAGPLPEEKADELALLTSELVTNAVLHARTILHLGVVRHGDEMLVVVADGNVVEPEQQPYSEDRIGGRGMVIIGNLAERWGISKVEGGKAVWFTVRLGATSGEGTGR